MNKFTNQIEHSRFNEHIYLLGNFEQRITVYSQQIRATNLAYSLFKENIITKDSNIAVIGAGVSGLTFCSSSILLGAKNITIFEQSSKSLPLWRNCSSRWLHPNLFNWPESNWNNEYTDIPILNWKSGIASDVGNQINNQWNTLYDYYQDSIELKIFYNSKIRISNNSNTVSWGSFGNHQAFDIIILSVGFGRDGNNNDENTCYWANDNILSLKETNQIYFLSGIGDGGIADLFRIRIQEFSQSIINDWLTLPEVIKITDKISIIESTANQILLKNGLSEYNNHLHSEYNKIITPTLNKDIINKLRLDTSVIFHSNSEYLYSPSSFPLNRFLLSRYLQIKDSAFRFVNGEISNLANLKKKNSSKGIFEVKIKDFESFKTNAFISRHGPLNPLIKESFNWIYNSPKALELKSKNKLDQTGKLPIFNLKDFVPPPKLLSLLQNNSKEERIAIAIVRHEKKNKFLFTRRKIKESHLEWGFPAKRVKHNYDIENALISECVQETGIKPKPIKFIGERIHRVTGQHLVYWFCTYESGKIKLGDANELSEVKWLSGSEIIKLSADLFSPIKDILNGKGN